MGIVLKQSFRNTLIIYLSFVVGGINTLVFYPRFLGEKFYGLVTILLSSTNLIMPLTAFGVQYTIIKFYSTYQDKQQRDKFLSVALILPLFIAIPIGFFWNYFHNFIVSKLASGNEQISNYTTLIYIISVCCAYFEVFYSWARVQLQTVFGNILKEFWNRAAVCLLLVAVFFKFISKTEFLFALTGMYILRTLVMMWYAFRCYFPKIQFSLPDNFNEILKYSAYIILAGSAGAIILDIDKVMIGGKDTLETAAYYTVAVFIGSFIEAPSRAMTQILQPLTSKSLSKNDKVEVESLYKKSSINLLLVGGLFFLLVNCGVHELFKLLPEKYAGGAPVVLMISLYKLYTMFLGNNVSIIQNSKFYRVALPIGVGSALLVYFLNKLFYYQLNFGTEGLALATLLVCVIFNTYRLWFVKRKFDMTPFTDKTLKLVLVIILLFVAFYFWDFKLFEYYLKFKTFSLPIHPIVNIILKCLLIAPIYVLLIYKIRVSSQINSLIDKILTK